MVPLCVSCATAARRWRWSNFDEAIDNQLSFRRVLVLGGVLFCGGVRLFVCFCLHVEVGRVL